MISKDQERLLSFFVGSLGYVVPGLSNESLKISKTLYPYLLGKRNTKYFYDLEKSLYGIKASMESLKSIVRCGGTVSFVNVPPTLELRLSHDTQANFIRWKRGSLLQSKKVDLMVLNLVETENLAEAHKKCVLLIAVGGPTTSQVHYPFNLNVTHPVLSDWFLGTIHGTYYLGKRSASDNKKPRVIGLLGKGRLKAPKY